MFGFWVFLMSDAILFGMGVRDLRDLGACHAGGPSLPALRHQKRLRRDPLLLASSFTFGMASLALKYKARHAAADRMVLAATLILGVPFLCFRTA